MNPEEFDSLKKLLALKRHEQPPPGYFNRLPNQIRARIQAEAHAPKQTWWSTWLHSFDAKPVLIGAYAAALVAVIITGVNLVSDHRPPASLATTPPNETPATVASNTNIALTTSTSAPPSFLTNPSARPLPTTPAGFNPNPK